MDFVTRKDNVMLRAAGRMLTVGEVRQEIADLHPTAPFEVELGEHAGIDASPTWGVVLVQPIEQFTDLQERLGWVLDEVCDDDRKSILVVDLLEALARHGLRTKP
jgi:hypothetical protein